MLRVFSVLRHMAAVKGLIKVWLVEKNLQRMARRTRRSARAKPTVATASEEVARVSSCRKSVLGEQGCLRFNKKVCLNLHIMPQLGTQGATLGPHESGSLQEVKAGGASSNKREAKAEREVESEVRHCVMTWQKIRLNRCLGRGLPARINREYMQCKQRS